MGLDAPLEHADVPRECRHVLDGAVVQVETDAGQEPLSARDEGSLAGRISRQKSFTLENRCQRGCGLGCGGEDGLLVGRVGAEDENSLNALPTLDGNHPHEPHGRRAPGESVSSGNARSAARTGLVAERHAPRTIFVSVRPKGHVLDRRECGEHPDLHLERQRRRQCQKRRIPRRMRVHLECKGVELRSRVAGDLVE